MYWVVYKQSYLIGEYGTTIETEDEIKCSGRFNEFGSAFGNFVLACGDESTARVYIKVYRGEWDYEGDIVCAYSNEWNDIKIGE